MYRITAINNEPDTDEEDYSKVTQEAEVSALMNITSINIKLASLDFPGILIGLYHIFWRLLLRFSLSFENAFCNRNRRRQF